MDEIIAAYQDPEVQEIYIVACHGVSKTMTCAGLSDYHFSVEGHPVYTTAPTFRQVNDLLWNQIRINRVEAMSRVVLPGRILEKPEIKAGKDKRWLAKGFVPKDQNSAQGPHLDNLLILVDEAAGVPGWLWVAIKGWMTNPNNKLIAIGNPNSEDSYFRAQFHEQLGRKGTRAIYINAHHSPNVTTWKGGKKKTPEEQEIPRRPIPALASDAWLEARREEWGEDSLDFKTKALGEWPERVEDERAIPMAWIIEAFERTDAAVRDGRLDPDGTPVSKLSLDVARKGKDKCCLSSLRERYLQVERYWDEPDLMQTAQVLHHVVADIKGDKPIWAAIDGNAVGGGVVDRASQLRKAHPGLWGQCQVNEIDWGATRDDKQSKKKSSKRTTKERHTTTNVARLYYKLRRRLDPSRPEEELLYLPTEASLKKVGLTRPQFAAQLNARMCWWNEFNQFCIESKTQMKDRVKKMKGSSSCDCGDSAAMLMDDAVTKKRGLKFKSSK